MLGGKNYLPKFWRPFLCSFALETLGWNSGDLFFCFFTLQTLFWNFEDLFFAFWHFRRWQTAFVQLRRQGIICLGENTKMRATFRLEAGGQLGGKAKIWGANAPRSAATALGWWESCYISLLLYKMTTPARFLSPDIQWYYKLWHPELYKCHMFTNFEWKSRRQAKFVTRSVNIKRTKPKSFFGSLEHFKNFSYHEPKKVCNNPSDFIGSWDTLLQQIMGKN